MVYSRLTAAAAWGSGAALQLAGECRARQLSRHQVPHYAKTALISQGCQQLYSPHAMLLLLAVCVTHTPGCPLCFHQGLLLVVYVHCMSF